MPRIRYNTVQDSYHRHAGRYQSRWAVYLRDLHHKVRVDCSVSLFTLTADGLKL